MYLSALRIHEAGRIGAVQRVDVYTDVEGPVITLWERSANDTAAMYTSGNVFSVPLGCGDGHWAWKARRLRIWVDSAFSPDGPPAIDAVVAEGFSTTPSTDLATVLHGRVPITYDPLPGIHVSPAANEGFSLLTVHRCTAGDAEPVHVRVSSTRPASSGHGTLWGDPIRVPVLPFERHPVGVDIVSRIQPALDQLLGHSNASVTGVRMSLDPVTSSDSLFYQVCNPHSSHRIAGLLTLWGHRGAHSVEPLTPLTSSALYSLCSLTPMERLSLRTVSLYPPNNTMASSGLRPRLDDRQRR